MFRLFSLASLLTLAPLAVRQVAAQSMPVGSRPVAITSGDLDGDGDMDLVVVNQQAQQNPPPPADLSVLLNDGTGRFAESARVPSLAREDVVTGDFDGDGDADVATTDPGGVSVHLSAGGVLGPAARYPTAGPGQFVFTRGIATADLTGDGVLDLAVANDNGPSVSIFPGVGDGTFGTRRDVLLGGGPTGIAAADLDGDGDLDLDLAVVASASGDLYVLLNPGDGTFTSVPPSGSAGSNPLDVVAADLDGDGDLDLGISDLFGSFYTRAGNGDGTFAPRLAVPVPSTGQGGSGLYSIAAGDFNRDGLVDLAAAQGSDAALALLLGGRTTPARLPVGDGPQGVVASDLDGDGDLDLGRHAVEHGLYPFQLRRRIVPDGR